MRDFGGFLGFVDGYNFDLRNLIFLFIFFDVGDIVFFISDGVFDNFDFVIVQCNYCISFELVRIYSFDFMLYEINRSVRDQEVIFFLISSSRSDQDILQRTYDVFIVRY